MTKYFNYEPRFNDVFSRNNLSRIRDGAYVTNLDNKKSKRIHWASLFIDRNTTAYFILWFFLNWINTSRSIKQN